MSERVFFRAVADHRAKADALYARIRDQLLQLLPNAMVEHVGSTSLRDGLTKGDLDVQIRVRASVGQAVFCSPWLRSASPGQEHVETLESFRTKLSRAISTARTSIRLNLGDALFVDNGRVLHGRGAITPESRRVLRRLWVRRQGRSGRRLIALGGGETQKIAACEQTKVTRVEVRSA